MTKSLGGTDTARSIATLATGDSAEVRFVSGGRMMMQRLAMLGIRPGVRVSVLHGPGGRGAVLRVGGARVALGRGVIEHILVAPATHSPALEAAAE